MRPGNSNCFSGRWCFSGPYITVMTNSLGVAEDFGPERGQPPGFHVGPIRACDRFYPWEPNYRF